MRIIATPLQKLWTPAEEISVTFIKPKHASQTKEIYLALDSLLDRWGLSYETSEPNPVHPSKQLLEKHYAHILSLPITAPMIREFSQEGVIVRAYRGSGVIEAIVDATGVTSPSKCAPWQVRRLFSDDDLEKALLEGRAVKNVLHRTGKIEESEQEARMWWAYIRTRFKSKDI